MKILNENILGLFPNRNQIQQCVTTLRNAKINADDISVERVLPEKKAPIIIPFPKEKMVRPKFALTLTVMGAGFGVVLGLLFYRDLALQKYSAVLLGVFLCAVLGAVIGIIFSRVVHSLSSDQTTELKPNEVLLTVHVEDEEHAKIAENILKAAGARIQVVRKPIEHLFQ